MEEKRKQARKIIFEWKKFNVQLFNIKNVFIAYILYTSSSYLCFNELYQRSLHYILSFLFFVPSISSIAFISFLFWLLLLYNCNRIHEIGSDIYNNNNNNRKLFNLSAFLLAYLYLPLHDCITIAFKNERESLCFSQGATNIFLYIFF